MAFGIPKLIEVKYDSAAVQNMQTLLKAAPFPNQAPIDAAAPWKLGIDYAYLKSLKERFETEWDYGIFSRKDAVPIILLHGWPGTFFDFHKVIEPLVNPSSNNLPAFDVVVPSLPGYFLSTLPRRDGWSIVDIARLFNGLMTSVLGYTTYTGQGGDWGSFTLRVMGTLFPESLKAMHFNMFRTPPVPGIDPSSFSTTEKRLLARREEFAKNGTGYSMIQSTKPFTIGLAIASSPVAILTYIGEKIYSWSDPDLVDQQDILDTVALYFLSGCFATSVVIYNQAKERPELSIPGKWLLENKFGFSAFPFEIGGSSKAEIANIGPLVYYKEHSRGGHFPALDCPEEYVEDLREFFGEHWSQL
ncbi:alpha/beta-hydrolase [Phellopilus nigrolimitatus]|nr:alpha/beta-hydrolase [Phellopilus nigrolimitatus]